MTLCSISASFITRQDRFDHARFAQALEASGLHVEASHDEAHFGFFAACKT